MAARHLKCQGIFLRPTPFPIRGAWFEKKGMWHNLKAKRIEGCFGHLCCVVWRVVVKEERPATRFLHDGGQLAVGKVRIYSLAGWEELMANATAAAPSNSEYGSFLETAGFWSPNILTLRHADLPFAPVHCKISIYHLMSLRP